MPERPSTFPKRVDAWLFGGTVFGLLVALGIWAGTKLEIPLQTPAMTGAEGTRKLATSRPRFIGAHERPNPVR